ncbi:MAG: tRNA (adenosine(37)-N6)-threonylcarbamoyltransferase complex ATPase subunit type 1 TsaE [Candidatus Peregrinibacteria bacterium]
MKSVYYTETPLATIQLGANLGRTLKVGDIVLLFGDLGAGKTHFTKGIAEGLGITRLVKSPTFTYVNNYPTPKATLHHYDLYRMEKNADLSSLGYEETLHDPRAINVVEWADRMGNRLPSRYIRVDIVAEENTRSIAIDFIYPTRLRAETVESYWEEWATPLHVREHCKQVANVGQKVAEAYIHELQIIDLNLVVTSCLLHDMARVCDFRELDRSKFPETVTDAKWAKWLELREKYKGRHHGDIAYDALIARGFTETAEVIRLHKSINLVEETDTYDSLEKKIVYYADKRVMHGTIVSLARRLKDGKERHGKYDTPEQRKVFDDVEKHTYSLEKELFESLELSPSDLV